MAKQLVQSMEDNFIETHSLVVEEPSNDARPRAQVIDLMTALKTSLEKSGRRVGTKPARRSKARKRG